MPSILTEHQFRQVTDHIWNETLDRRKGAFKKALWYGNKSRVFGQNKGVRKLIRNTPRKFVSFSIGKIPVLGDVLSFVADTAVNFTKDTYAAHIKSKIKTLPSSETERQRKNIKKEVKDLKTNAVAVIDRNLVKLKDARQGIPPRLNDFLGSAGESIDSRAEKAQKLIRKIFEAYYYEHKILGLTSKLREATERIDEDIKKLNEDTLTLYHQIEDILLTDFDE